MRSTSVRTHTVRDSISAVVCQAQAFASHSAHKPIHIYAKYLYGNFMQISQPHTHTHKPPNHDYHAHPMADLRIAAVVRAFSPQMNCKL